MTHEDFVTHEQAKILKEWGFNELTTHYYESDGTLHEQGIYIGPTAGDVVTISTVFDCGHNYIKSSEAVDAPNLEQVQKWFRKKHNIDIDIDSVYHRLDTGDKIMYGLRIGIQRTFQKNFYLHHDTYEQALSAGIDKALELLKSENNGK